MAARAGLRPLRVCPNAVLATAALMALQFDVWFGSLAALTFLLSGLALWLRRPAQAPADLLRFWPILLVPAWCILSALWSNEPALSLRAGIQLGLTVIIATAMAVRLAPRTFLLAAFAAFGTAAMASLLFGRVRGDGAGWIGIFGSKNEFAFAMSTLVLLSLALLLDRAGGRAGGRTRLIALGGLGLGSALLLLGESSGALVSTAFAGALGLALVGLRPVAPPARLLVLLLATLGLAALALIAYGYREALLDVFLETTGKDVTLTGRTELWAEALREIAAHPLLGQGFQAIWVAGNPVAEAMWDRFGIEARSGFHFHNTWLSNAVEIGLVGVAIQLGAFLATLALVGRWVVARQTAASLFFAMFMARQAATSLVEVVVYLNFNVMTILTIVALVYGVRVLSEAPARVPSHGWAAA